MRIFAYVDVDHKGYSIGRTAAKHLARYGFLCPKSAAEKTEVDRWVRETGGIHGEARGIFCNWLPVES